MTSLLVLNAGSSSIKFGAYSASDPLRKQLSGSIARLGSGAASLTFHDGIRGERGSADLACADAAASIGALTEWIDCRVGFSKIRAVGHRVVHGMGHSEPVAVTRELVAELQRISPYDPEHLPREIAWMQALGERYPELPQVACFDTAFHSTLPRVARMLPIPRRFEAKGVRRYGFHGLSYAYLMEELERVAGLEVARGRVILAHLGNGASLAAVHAGKCIDTTMGFTPAGGLPMGTRPGDLDPGVAWYMMATEGLTPDQFSHIINQESGMVGISGTSADMRDLLAVESIDERAAEAVAHFCYQARKWIGALTAALGGLETIVFSGGIGEHSAAIRSRICQGLEFLGVELDEARNEAVEPLISARASRVAVRVIRTDEELMIARHVLRLFPPGPAEGAE